MRKSCISLFLVLLLILPLLTGCDAKKPEPTPAPTAAPVALTIVGSWPDCRAIDEIAALFNARYPNCTVTYEYLQDYYVSLEKRVTGDNPIDLFITNNIQEDSPLLPYALDLMNCPGLDLSNTFDGLTKNFTFRASTGDRAQLYAIPLGAEMRGMYVNLTLLHSLGLEAPTDRDTFLAACAVLREHGYIPLHGNPGKFAQTLMYPWICNNIANAEDYAAAYAAVNARGEGMLAYVDEPFRFLYDRMAAGDYDYKTAQNDGLFTDSSDEAYARNFLNIVKDGDTFTKRDDVGIVAFMPSAISMENVVYKVKEDYHSLIEYAFIPAPLGENGGFVYLSPAHGIAAVKQSANVDWAVKFLDFLFEPENNKTFSQAFNCIPNTKEAFAYIAGRFDIPANHISHLGQVTFDYDLYTVVNSVMVEISKGNNPKYMLDDGAGNLSLYPYEHYIDEFKDKYLVQ